MYIKLSSKKNIRLFIFTVVIFLISIFLLKDLGHIIRKTYNLRNTKLIPNIVNFIIFGKNELDFVNFLSISSALKVQRPKKILIHCDCREFQGRYWPLLQNVAEKLKVPLSVVHLRKPTHVFGQSLSSVYHATDIARIQILMQYGGIYVDTDVLILRPLDYFLRFEMVLGWPPNEYIGTQVLIAKRDARFLKLWLKGYTRYKPRQWYYNAGQYPTEQILEKDPSLVHRVPYLFGVQNLLDKLYGLEPWPAWRDYFTIHLLSRHPPAPKGLNESSVLWEKSPFGEIAKWLLFETEPRYKFSNSQHYNSERFLVSGTDRIGDSSSVKHWLSDYDESTFQNVDYII